MDPGDDELGSESAIGTLIGKFNVRRLEWRAVPLGRGGREERFNCVWVWGCEVECGNRPVEATDVEVSSMAEKSSIADQPLRRNFGGGD